MQDRVSNMGTIFQASIASYIPPTSICRVYHNPSQDNKVQNVLEQFGTENYIAIWGVWGLVEASETTCPRFLYIGDSAQEDQDYFTGSPGRPNLNDPHRRKDLGAILLTRLCLVT